LILERRYKSIFSINVQTIVTKTKKSSKSIIGVSEYMLTPSERHFICNIWKTWAITTIPEQGTHHRE